MIFPIKVGLEPYGRSFYTCNLVYWIGRRAHRRRPLVKLHPYPDSHPTALKLGPPFNRRLLLPRIFDHLAFRHFRSNFATSGKENNLPDLFRSGAAVVVVVDVVVTFVVFLSFGFFSREMMKEMILLVKSQSDSKARLTLSYPLFFFVCSFLHLFLISSNEETENLDAAGFESRLRVCGRFTFERSTDTQTLIDVVNGAKVRERERKKCVCRRD